MGKESEKSSSFICYNCKERNFFDKSEYAGKYEAEILLEMKTGTSRIKEVSIECKSCREINSVKIEY
jgi:hypothetical protein